MRVGTFGKYVVSAYAIQQGTKWAGVFQARVFDQALSTSSVWRDDTHTDGTFDFRDEAEETAFIEAQSALNH